MMIPYIILTIENDDDREFMADLYRTYHRLLYKEIYEIVQDSWNTEDLMQSLLEKLIDHIDQLRSFDTRQLIISALQPITLPIITIEQRKRIILSILTPTMSHPHPVWKTVSSIVKILHPSHLSGII